METCPQCGQQKELSDSIGICFDCVEEKDDDQIQINE